METKYINEITDIIDKYSYAMFDIDYKEAINEIIKIFNIRIKEINKDLRKEYQDILLSSLFDICCRLDKSDIKAYVKLFKKYNIYKYANKKTDAFFIKYFINSYINIYMLKNRKFEYFKKRYKNFIGKKLQRIISVFIYNKKKLNTFQSLKTLLPKELYVDYMELVITTKCTLKCKNCANLMYMYDKPYDVEKDTIIESIKKLSNCVDGISTFRILGGEPFCNTNLKYFLKEMPVDKFKEIVIVTNGTIVPKDEELIKIMREKNITVYISDYKEYSYKKEELLELLEKENINYEMDDEVYTRWVDYGDLENRNRSKKDLKEQFYYCNIICKTILNGVIYYCPRVAHGIDLGKIDKIKGEYVDLLNNSDKENKKQIKKLMLRGKYIHACNYCNYATKDGKYIPIAEQNLNKTKETTKV